MGAPARDLPGLPPPGLSWRGVLVAQLHKDGRTIDAWLGGCTEATQRTLQFMWREFWARREQLSPIGDWFVWLLLAGRGSGKTRSGAEWVRERVYAGARSIALVAKTPAGARDVMIEGKPDPPGILGVFPPQARPKYEPSKRRVTFHTGAIATAYSAAEPDQLRRP